MDTFTSIWNRLRLRAPNIDPFLAQDMVRDSFNRLAERRDWSWLRNHSSFYPPAFSTAGFTVAINPNSYLVTVDSGGNFFTPQMTGVQIRFGGLSGTSYPTYTLNNYISPTQFLLDTPWIGPALNHQQFVVFQCYFPVPLDFQSWITLVNTTANYKLWTNLTQAELDLADPQRIQQGITFACAYYDTTQNFNGTVGPVLQIVGTGAAPISTTGPDGFTFPESSIYSVQIVTGGALGTATYSWQQNAGGSSPVITTPTNQTAVFLSSGVGLIFPAGTYVSGDTFVLNCIAGATTGALRYELWPRPVNAPYSYPFIYRKIPPDLTDASPQLPHLIANRGDVLLEMCLAQCAAFPGTDTTRNPYYDLTLARMHEAKAETLIYELEKKDDDTAEHDLSYQNLPFYPAPWLDGSWLQTHAVYPAP